MHVYEGASELGKRGLQTSEMLQMQCICTLVLTNEWAAHRACALIFLVKDGTQSMTAVWTLQRQCNMMSTCKLSLLCSWKGTALYYRLVLSDNDATAYRRQ